MKVQFCSRGQAMKLIERGTFKQDGVALISVSDTRTEEKFMRSLWKESEPFDQEAARFFKFGDINSPESGFTKRTAQYIIEFCNEALKRKQDIIVHCFAGVSRSGAIAKFINEYFMLGNEYLENYTGHNRYVFDKLLRTAGVETLSSYYEKLEEES